MKTFLFYDLETTGLNKCFDQVVQFAAIRTNTQFHELERYSTLVKLRPDVIYSPEAIMTNRISIARILCRNYLSNMSTTFREEKHGQ